jgi:CRP-like cAMP-binding protein
LEGDPCAGLYVVQEGWLKSVKVSPAGREQVVRFIGPGETFNEVGLLADTPNQVTVIALEAATVWLIRRDVLVRLLEADRRLARAITQNLANRVLHLMSLIEDLSLRTVESRLARVSSGWNGTRSRSSIVPRWRPGLCWNYNPWAYPTKVGDRSSLG